jgi:DNA polymerase II large subunit
MLAEVHCEKFTVANVPRPAQTMNPSLEVEIDKHEIDRHEIDRHGSDRHGGDRHEIDTLEIDRHQIDRHEIDTIRSIPSCRYNQTDIDQDGIDKSRLTRCKVNDGDLILTTANRMSRSARSRRS